MVGGGDTLPQQGAVSQALWKDIGPRNPGTVVEIEQPVDELLGCDGEASGRSMEATPFRCTEPIVLS
jgi:hypothetical protein